MPYEDRNNEFEQYLTSSEPGVKERARNWSIAINLQDTSNFDNVILANLTST